MTPGVVVIRGTSVSAGHEAALHKLAEDQFAGFELDTGFEPTVLPGSNWEAMSNRLLYAIAALDSGEAQMAPDSIRIRGISSDASTFGARLAFGPEEYLYVTAGERGSPERAQDLGDLAGSVLRITEDGGVPDDNPFVGRDGVRPEIFSYGHRNPQGLARHPQTGEIWAVEHGPRGGDELNLIEAGFSSSSWRSS